MSRYYNMDFTVVGVEEDKVDAVCDAIHELWDDAADATIDDVGVITAGGEGYLHGGETEEQFADRAAKVIFEANGQCCAIEIKATYLEDLPHEIYVYDAKCYKRLMKKKGENNE